MINILLADTNPAMVDAWGFGLQNLEDHIPKENPPCYVAAVQGSILELEADVIVSPANSFGFMDGGIDFAYVGRFGEHIQDQLQTYIKETWDGELPVGCAAVIATDDKATPYIIAAPTMRVPMILKDSVNPYLATAAALRMAKRSPAIERLGRLKSGGLRIAFPGMGTGCGAVPFDVCCRQMFHAIYDVMIGGEFPQTWQAAQNYQRFLIEG